MRGQGQAAITREVTRLVLGLGLADGLDVPGSSAAKLSGPANSSLPNSPWGSPKSRKGLEGGRSYREESVQIVRYPCSADFGDLSFSVPY